MAGTLSEFTQAVGAFQGSMRQLSVQKAVSNATSVMQGINAEVKNEGEKRVAFQNLSNELALKLTGIGADPQQVMQAASAIAPQQFANPQQAITEGALQGNVDLTRRGVAAQTLADQPTQSRFDRTMRVQEAQLMLEQARSQGTDMADASKNVQGVLDMSGLNVTKGLPGELTKDQRKAFIGNAGFGNTKISAIAIDPTAAKELRTQFAEAKGVNSAINELKGLAKEPGASVRPAVIAKAEALQAQLKALIRVPVTGGGNVSTFEQELLKSVAANPVSIFNFAGGPEAALDVLQKTINKKAAAAAQQSGLQFLAPLTPDEDQAIKFIKANPKDSRAEETIRLIEGNRQERGARMALE